MEIFDPLKMSASLSNIELEWVEHTNSGWSTKDCDNLANRDFVQIVYENLLHNKEVRIAPASTVSYNDVQMLPDFQSDLHVTSDLDQYVTSLLVAQQELAKAICTQTNFAVVLKQRLLILKRIFYALVRKYHDKEKVLNNVIYTPITRDVPASDSNALIEIGVHTGLTLIFAVLRQNWQTSAALGVPCLCNSVLKTAVDMVQKLPPFALTNDAQLNNLGITSLDQVSSFLKDVVLNVLEADLEGKLLASELLLLIAVQRGSLRYILDWIDMALSAVNKLSDNQKICSAIFRNILAQFRASKSNSNQSENSITDSMTIYEAAVELMEELVAMSIGCSGDMFSNFEETAENVPQDKKVQSQVYVWGSNSSHQLAEGVLDKVYTPVKSSIFVNAHQVGSIILYIIICI